MGEGGSAAGHYHARGLLSQQLDMVWRLETPGVEVGLWPCRITVPLLRVAPSRLVRELMLTGRRMNARETRARGLVHEVAPGGRSTTGQLERCTRLGPLSSGAS